MLTGLMAGLSFPITAVNQTRAAFQSVLGDLRDLRRQLGFIADEGQRAGRAMRNVGAGLTAAVTVPVAGLAASVLGTSADFEAAMIRVQAVSGATGAELDALSGLAREMGATTRFSAVQAADALGILAMGGMSVEQQIGALPGVLQLAAASGMDLAAASSAAMDVMSQWGFAVDDIQRVNDALALTANTANTDVPELSYAMAEVGAIARMAGLEFEEVAAALGLMSNAGFRGGRAGTALRGGIARLLNPVGEAADAVEELGLNIMDSEGRMRPLVDLLTDVAPHANDAALMMQLFGQEAGPGMAALLTAGPEALRGLTEDLEASGGTAQRVADLMNQGLHPALGNLGSAWDDLRIAIGESGLLDFATDMVNRLTGLVSRLADTDPALLRVGTGLAFAAAAAGPLLAGLGFLIIGVSAAIPALVGLAVAAAPIALVVAGVAALGGAAYLIYQNWGGVSDWWRGIWDDVGGAFDGVWARIGEAIGANDPDTLIGAVWGEVGAWFRGLLVDLPMGITDVFMQIMDVIAGTYTPAQVFGEVWNNVNGWFGERLSGLGEIFSLAWGSVSSLTEGWPDDAHGWGRLVGSSIAAGIDAVAEGGQFIASRVAAAWSFAQENAHTWPASALSWGRDAIDGLINGVREMVPMVVEAIRGIWSSIVEEVSSWPGRLIQTGRDMVNGLIQGLSEGDGLVASVMRRIMGDTITAAEDEAGIQSPSRVFREIGQFLTEGLAQGIATGTGQPVEAMRGLMHQVSDLGHEAAQGLQDFGSSFASFIGPIVRGTQTLGQAFDQLKGRIADALINTGLQGIGNFLFAGMGGGGSGISSLIQSVLGFADGAAFRAGSLVPFADGGIVSSPTLFPMAGGRTGLMGEAGAEAIMPLARTASGALGVRMTGGGVDGRVQGPSEVIVRLDVPTGVTIAESVQIAGDVAVRVVAQNNELMAEQRKRAAG